MDEFLIELQAKLDEAKSKGNINSDILNKLQGKVNELKLQAVIDDKSISNLVKQLESVLNQKINISNINFNTSNAQKAGQHIGNIVSDEVNNALGKITSKEIGVAFKVEKTDSDEFNHAVDEEIQKLQQAKNKLTSVRYTTNTEQRQTQDIFGNVDYEHVEKLTGAIFRYNTETGEAITKTMKWAQIGMTVDDKGNDVPLMGWVQGLTTYNKSLDESSVKTDTFVDKQKTAVTNLSNQLATIESKFNSSKKPLSDDYDIAQVENKIFDVRKAIDTLSTSSKTGFTDAKNAVTTEITELNNLITTLQNAEYAATSLRTKDIKTVKTDEENSLNAFVEKMKQSGHYTDKLEQDVAKLRKQLNGVFDASTLTTYLNGLSNLQSEFKAVDATAKTAEKATKIQTNVEAEKKILTLYKNELKEAGVLTGDVKQKIQDMFHSLSKVDSQNGLTTWRAELKGVKAETDAVLKSVTQLSSKKLDEIQLSIDNGTYGTTYDNLIAKTEQWSFQNDKLTASVEELKSAYKGFDNVNTDEEKIAAAKRWEQAVKSVNNAIKQTKLKYATDSQISAFHQKLQEFYDKNTATHRLWGNDLKKMLNDTSNGAKVTNTDLETMKSNLDNINNAARKANKLGKSWFDTIRSNVQSYLPWVSMAGVIGEATQQVRKMYKAVYDIDTAMTELAKVSDTTSQRLTQSLEKSTKTAEKYGATINEVISATADWSRLGYDIDSAEKLAEVATIYKNVGDGIDINTANESLVSTLQGFGKTADEALHIIDVFNEVANNYAIGSDGIGEALQRSASSMNAAGNTLEETVALITAANTVVQDPSSVGNAYKTISMRIRGAKTELEEMGEDTEGMTESTAKLQKEILALSGVDIMKDKNTFKSTYQILDELSSKWSKLTDIQRASITELIAGKRQGNIISALMENFDVARDSLETALNSEGSAMKEQETYLSSLEAKTKQFEAAFQSLSSTVLDSNLIKFFVDLGTTGVSSLEGLFKILNSINSLGGLTNGSFGGLGAISGLLMNRAGIGERTMFRW